MTKTNLQIINFLNFAGHYMKQHEERTKFRYALERLGKRLQKQIESYQEANADLQIEHAAVDGQGVLLTTPDGGFRFTKDGLRSRNKAQKELLEKPVEFEPYMATEVPDDLTEAEKQAASGFVLPEQAEQPEEEPREYNAEAPTG